MAKIVRTTVTDAVGHGRQHAGRVPCDLLPIPYACYATHRSTSNYGFNGLMPLLTEIVHIKTRSERISGFSQPIAMCQGVTHGIGQCGRVRDYGLTATLQQLQHPSASVADDRDATQHGFVRDAVPSFHHARHTQDDVAAVQQPNERMTIQA